MPFQTIETLKSTSDGKNDEANIKTKSKHNIYTYIRKQF